MSADHEALEWGHTRTGSKAHLIDTSGATSILILGSDEYDNDTHDRALCGTISEFESPDGTPETREEVCFACARKAYKKGYIDDPDPFTDEELQGIRRGAE